MGAGRRVSVAEGLCSSRTCGPLGRRWGALLPWVLHVASLPRPGGRGPARGTSTSSARTRSALLGRFLSFPFSSMSSFLFSVIF